MTTPTFETNDFVIRVHDGYNTVMRLRPTTGDGTAVTEPLSSIPDGVLLIGSFWRDEKREWSEGYRQSADPLALFECMRSLRHGDQQLEILNQPSWFQTDYLLTWALQSHAVVVQDASDALYQIYPTEFEPYEMRSGEFRDVAKTFGARAATGEILPVSDKDPLEVYNQLVVMFGPLAIQRRGFLADSPRSPDGKLHEAIVLDSFVEVDDIVTVYPPASETLREGMSYRCVGHRKYLSTYDFGELSPDRQRGIYENVGSALFVPVDQPDLEPQSINLHQAIFQTPKSKDAIRATERWKAQRDGVYVGSLPKTKFVVGDEVTVVSSRGRKLEVGERAEIARVRYHDGYRTEEIGEVEYDVRYFALNPDTSPGQPKFLSDGSQTLKENELQLKLRGNLWFYLHDRSKIGFANLQEEITFHSMLGHLVDMRHPRTNDFMSLTKDEAVAMIERGEGCGIRVSPGFFGNEPTTHVYSIPSQPSLERRVRAKTLEGFATA